MTYNSLSTSLPQVIHNSTEWMPIAARWTASKSGYQLPFLSPIFDQTFILCSNSVFSINTVQIRFFIIPPDRQALSVPTIPFQQFREMWLDPIFETFSALAIHEAVHNELVSVYEREFIEEMLNHPTPRIIIHKDSQLDATEHILRNTIEAKISKYTKYNPLINNANDRGEVKTLSYIAVKGLLYFATNDNNTIN